MLTTFCVLIVSASCALGVEDPGWNNFMFGPGSTPAETRHGITNTSGTIPQWLDGVWLQNGPGKFEWDSKDGRKRRLVNGGDGYGKVESFDIRGGAVTYSSVFIKSGWWNNSVKADDIAPSLCFATPNPPRDSDKSKQWRNAMSPNDNYAVSVMPVGGRPLLLSDMPGSIEFHTDTLTFDKANKAGPTGGFHDEPRFPLGMMGAFGSAHPLYTGSSLDGSGELYGIINAHKLTLKDPRQEETRLFRIDGANSTGSAKNPWLTRRQVASLRFPNGSFAPYMHSFAMLAMPDKHGAVPSRPTHAVMVAHAMHIAFAKIIAGEGKVPITTGFDIDFKRPLTFYVVSLSDGTITHQLKHDFGILVSHVVNAFVADAKLVVDLVGYDFLFFNRFNANVQLNKTARDNYGHRARTYRFEVPLDNSPGTTTDLLPERDFEFPTINEAWKGRRYCYFYGYEQSYKRMKPGPGATGFASMAIVKHDICSNSTATFAKPYHYFAEPFFVPRPGSTTEDDGVVLVLAQDGAHGKGVLFTLDAKDLSLMATTPLPTLTTIKTHGRFIWRRALKQN